MRLVITTIFLLASVVANAATVTIDFDEVTPQYVFGGGLMVESKGYTFDAQPMLGDPPEAGVSSSGVWAAADCFSWGPGCGAAVIMEKIDGNSFAISSFDAGGYYGVDFGGTISGGATADLSAAIGTGDWLQLEQFQVYSYCSGPFGCGEYDVYLDDIVVSAVPVPAAAWLFGSALAGLGWLRRKQTV
jgi:hypothetical protein